MRLLIIFTTVETQHIHHRIRHNFTTKNATISPQDLFLAFSLLPIHFPLETLKLKLIKIRFKLSNNLINLTLAVYPATPPNNPTFMQSTNHLIKKHKKAFPFPDYYSATNDYFNSKPIEVNDLFFAI
jgi:hypothetical protein